MTARLDRMEEAEMIRRLPDPDDRRGVLVEMTAKGKRAIDAAIDKQTEAHEPFLKVLTSRERHQFADMLSGQLLAFERELP